ncbi:MAG: hypothetical protein JO113_04620 [Candidatus Eremiobacteraeota bacterium]|nr:hypothetical protein [Candidatus Eremiobacteraeota bacterium]
MTKSVAGLLAAFVLTSCSAAVPPAPNVASMTQVARRSHSLLYVSDLQHFEVYVYTFPSLALQYTLKGFNEPEGLCADRSGNVWIANTGNNNMLEYAHGGTSPIASLGDPTGYPVGCAVDPLTGNLAVTNFYDFSGGGSVLIYDRARGLPHIYANKTQYYYYFAGYDGAGDLYVSGTTSKHVYVLAVLPRRRRAMSLVTISGAKLYVPGTVAWNSSTLVLGDQQCQNKQTSCLYALSVAGRTARVTGTTPLRGSCDVVQAWVGATQIAAGDDAAYCAHGTSSVDIWSYPGGGSPRGHASGPGIPVGATVSSSP